MSICVDLMLSVGHREGRVLNLLHMFRWSLFTAIIIVWRNISRRKCG